MARIHRVRVGCRPTVYLCTGSDCTDETSGQALREALAGHGEICEVRCQKICKGPVVGVEIDDRIEWFSRLKTQGMRKHLARLLSSGELHTSLSARRLRKRSGKFREDRDLAAK